MGFVKQMMEHDLSLMQTLDGNYIIHTTQNGKQRVLDGMLQERTAFIPGGSIDIVTTEIILSVRSIDAKNINVNDRIVVDFGSYSVASIRADNEAITELVLERL